MASILTVLNCVQCCRQIFLFKILSFVHGNMCVDKFIMLLTQALSFHICHADMPLIDHTNHLFINCFAFSNNNTVNAQNYKAKTMLGPPSLEFWNYVFIYFYIFLFFSCRSAARRLILGVAMSHTTTHLSVGLLWTSDQLVAETSTWQHSTPTTKIKWNTDVMRQDVYFITADFLYMFRASSVHHQEYKILTRQPPVQVVIFAGRCSLSHVRGERP